MQGDPTVKLIPYRLRWEFGRRFPRILSWWKGAKERVSYEIFLTSNLNGWGRFMLWRLGIKIAFEAEMDKKRVRIDSETARRGLSSEMKRLYRVSPLKEESLNNDEGLFRLQFMGRQLAFHYTKMTRGSVLFVLREFFIKEPYKELDVEGRTVLDIGANIGDSAVYFCCRGAKKVISLEPVPTFYDAACTNVVANGFEDRVLLLNEGAGRSGYVTVSPEMVVHAATALKGSDSGLRVKINSFAELLQRFEFDAAVLKLNCEGCEYDFLTDVTPGQLAKFKCIFLEYHLGAETLVKKLKDAGFRVRRWNVRPGYDSPDYDRSETAYVLAKSRR